MTSSATPSMPTRMPRNRPDLRCVGLIVAGLALLSPSAAHDVAADPVPEAPGWRVGAGVAVTAIGAKDPIPSATLPGVLDTGENAPDQRGLGLEHAVIGAGLRFNDIFGANLAVGWHAGESVHLEAAWVQARWAHGRGAVDAGCGARQGADGQRAVRCRRLRPLFAGAVGQAGIAQQRLVRRRCRAGMAWHGRFAAAQGRRRRLARQRVPRRRRPSGRAVAACSTGLCRPRVGRVLRLPAAHGTRQLCPRRRTQVTPTTCRTASSA